MKATISVEMLVMVVFLIIIIAVLFGLINPSISQKMETSKPPEGCETNNDCINSEFGYKCMNIENKGWKCGCISNGDCTDNKICKNNVCS
ncbi:MAG: hypothetical protein KQA40_01005 [Candidatus Aenigmarchaeota archaeon]|nr:hypothetical protein [Candidatus Aenigmarchaeota archaeon]